MQVKRFFIIASLPMIKNAVNILGEISTIPPEKIKFYNEVFIPLIEEQSKQQVTFSDDPNQKLIAHHQVFYVTSKDLAEKYTRVFRKPINSKQVVENYLEILTDQGVIESKENPENKRQNLYYISSKLSTVNLDKLVERCREYTNDNERQSFAYIWSCLVKPFQLSMQMGKLMRIYDNEHEKINFTLFNKISLLHIRDYVDNQGAENQ